MFTCFPRLYHKCWTKYLWLGKARRSSGFCLLRDSGTLYSCDGLISNRRITLMSFRNDVNTIEKGEGLSTSKWLGHGCANHDTEGKRFKFPHPLLWRNEASLLDQWRTMYFPLALFAYTVCCQRTEQCFSVLRTHKSDAVDGSSGRRYVTDQWHNVPLLRARGLGDRDTVASHSSRPAFLNLWSPDHWRSVMMVRRSANITK